MRINEWKERLLLGQLDDELETLYGEAPALARTRYLSVLDAFKARYGDADTVILSAPGRTELAGNHTDHQNGNVLCAAVTMDTLAVVSPRADSLVRIHSQGFGDIALQLDALDARAEEAGTSEAIVRGIAANFRRRGYRVGGLDAVVTSNVPAGGGLSSSAAFEILLAAAFSHLYNSDALQPLTLAIIGQAAERDYFGKPCGLLDQAASACGGITRIDFADPASPAVERLRFDFRDSGYVLCAVDTRTSHADLTDDYAAIPAEMRSVAAFFGRTVLREVDSEVFFNAKENGSLSSVLPARSILRAEHFFEENARVDVMAEALRRGDIAQYMELMNASGRSSREKLQNVIPSLHPEMRSMAEALDRAGALLQGKGAWRIHGGGFAGCIQCLVPTADFPAFRSAMDGYYGNGACREMRIRPCGPSILGASSKKGD